MTTILGSVTVSCVHKIPVSDAETFDPARVNVLYSSGGGAPQTILQDNSAPCNQAAGWKHSADQKQIIICGQACTRVQSDPNAGIDVEFGGKTQVK